MAHHPQQSYPVAYIVSLSSRALVNTKINVIFGILLVYSEKSSTFATKQFQPTRLVENESFQKTDSIICEFHFL